MEERLLCRERYVRADLVGIAANGSVFAVPVVNDLARTIGIPPVWTRIAWTWLVRGSQIRSEKIVLVAAFRSPERRYGE
jgi:hypothetical protein